MKIVVSIKQVPARDSILRLDPDQPWVDDSSLSWEINEPDAYALEAALQFRERVGEGEVIALSAGPARASQALREALAKGADRAIHVEQDVSSWDTLRLAQLIATAIRDEGPDLVLTGLQSDDLGFGQAGVAIAELLGFAHSTIVMSLEPQNGGIRVKRELEDGFFQFVTLPLPAVLTIQSGSYKLRYATLMGIKRAKSKEIRTIPAAADAASSTVTLDRVYFPEKGKGAQLFTGDSKEAARQLVEKLRSEARVL